MSRGSKIFVAVSIGVLLCALGLAANAIFGNPISRAIARHSAEEYIVKYTDSEYRLEEVTYNFKSGAYSAHVRSLTSEDRYFNVYLSAFGKVKGDSYENVSSGWNTCRRVEGEYQALAERVFALPQWNVSTGIINGELKGCEQLSWEPDGEYDLTALGEELGHIVVHVSDSDISAKRAAELLLLLKELFDREKLPFRTVDLVLRLPEDPEGKFKEDSSALQLYDILYSDIYPEGLEDRLLSR